MRQVIEEMRAETTGGSWFLDVDVCCQVYRCAGRRPMNVTVPASSVLMAGSRVRIG
jgi:hypothetical protein